MKLKDLITEKLELGLGGYKAYNEVTERDLNNIEINLKRFVRDLQRDKDNPDNKKMAAELKQLYKKDFMNLRSKYEKWFKGNT